jgi:hypothetical protein
MAKDVFLCHNSKDKPEVEKIRIELLQRGIDAWLDKYDFEPFRRWQDQLEEIIGQIEAAAIFIGSSPVGPWADIEMREFLVEFVKRELRMGLVILPSCNYTLTELERETPRFLRSFHWVDFRQQDPDPMKQLIWGITGIKPESQPVVQTQQLQISSPPQKIWLLSDFSSEKGIDYTYLSKLLSEGKWEDANTLTYQLMLDVVGKNKSDKLTEEDLRNFPCTDLKTIDKLWLNHSNSKFGFSIQKEIYLSIGGKLNSIFDQILWKNFGDIVGWRDLNGDYFFDASDDQHTFDTSAPKGHLPVLMEYDNPGIVINIFPRIEAYIQSQTIKPLELLNSHLGYTSNTSATQAVETIQSAIDIDDLGSEKGVDYTRLRDLLKAGNWKDADYETYLVMLKAAGREEGDWIRTEELLKFPCTDLRTIDKLWIKHSNGQFGFSVQKQIYLSVGGIADGRYYKETWEKFGDKVGWRMSEEWITYDKVIFSTFTKKGHLPSECGLVVGEDNGMEALLLRLVNCNI